MSSTPPGAPARFVLTLDCPDRPGIVHAVSGFFAARGANIVESQQFGDPLTGRFFMRLDVALDPAADPAGGGATADSLAADFAAVAEPFSMGFELWDTRVPRRVLVMVSKHLH